MFSPQEVVYVLGGGPSFDRALLPSLRGRRLIAVNRAIVEAPFCDVGFWLDANVWDWYGEEIKKSPCRKITIHSLVNENVERWTPSGKRGLELHKSNTIRTGNSSGYSAVGLAVSLGARRIVLLGFDGRTFGDQAHWHKEHPRPTGQRALQNIASEFGSLVKPLQEAGVEVWNASPRSAIHVFPKTTLEGALSGAWPPPPLQPERQVPRGAHVMVATVPPWPGAALLEAIEGARHVSGGVLPEDDRPALSWSSRGPSASICGRRRAPWVVAENGALHHWTPGSVSLSFGDFNGGGLLPKSNGPRSWRPRVQPLLAPEADAPVLVVGQMGGMDHHVTMPPGWPDEIVAALRKETKRPVWFKPHPKRPTSPSWARADRTIHPETKIEDVLPKVHAVVGWTSSALTVAAAHLVPVVCLGPRAWPASVCERSIVGLDDIKPPDRHAVDALLDEMTWSNWGRDELRDAWRWLWTAPLQ